MRNNIIRRCNDVVGLVEPQVQKERRLGITLFIEPRDRLINDDLAGIAFNLSYRLAVAKEVDRVLVARAGPAVHAEPVVKTMVFRRQFELRRF